MMARQEWSAETYSRDAGFVAELGAGVVEWLSPVSGEKVLDLGCGSGALTREIAQKGVTVVGVDSAPGEFYGEAGARDAAGRR